MWFEKWIENGAPDKGDLEEDSYSILRQHYMQKEGRLYPIKEGIVACKKRDYQSQLYQMDLLFRSHDQMDHQGVD